MTETTEALITPPLSLLHGASLFSDFDGTLVELAARPDAVIVNDRLRALLRRLDRVLDGRIAIVSGRNADQIAAFLPDAPLSISGSHGIELRRPGRPDRAVDTPAWIEQAARDAEALRQAHPGVLVEVKPFGIAFHYRAAPDAEAACIALAKTLAAPDRHIQPGKMVVEVRLAGGDKGSALQGFMAEPDMAGTRPIFLGDDLNDEPGFRVAAELGGAGILVGTARESAARYRLEDVPAMIAWLEAAAGEQEG